MWSFNNHLQCQAFPMTMIASLSYTVFVLVPADREPNGQYRDHLVGQLL